MNSININRLMMHMMDFEHKKVFRSQSFVDINETSYDYYHKKLEKTLNAPTMKELTVGSLHELILRTDMMIDSDEEFIRQSYEITEQLFKLGSVIQDMPNSNVMFVDCNADGQRHIVIVKLNYRTIPMSVVEEGVVRVTKQQVLPTAGATIEEAIILNKDTKQLFLIEKKFLIDGKNDYYLNSQWIKGEEKLTDREKYNTLKRVVRKLDELYHVTDGNALPLIKQELNKCEENNQVIKPIEIAKKVLQKDYQAQEESEMMLKDQGIDENDVIKSLSVPIKDKCKMVLDNNIEIILSLEDYLNGSFIHKNQEADGTYSLTVKDIHEIIIK